MVLLRQIAAGLAALLACAAASASTGDERPERLTFKQEEFAVFSIDQRPARQWRILRHERRDHLLLVEIGWRYLLVDAEEKEVFELDPESFIRRKGELEWEDAEGLVASPPRWAALERRRAAGESTRRWPQRLPSDEWTVRDIGTAWMVRFRLSAEGRTFELLLRHGRQRRRLY
jgi:hypothetical protein